MKYNLTIRLAALKDAEELSKLICDNAKIIIQPHYSAVQWGVFIDYYSIEAMKEKINSQIVFCAELEGKIVGTVSLNKNFVVGFYTHLDHVGQGIGKQLMDYLEQFAKENGIQLLQLSSVPTGVPFYAKNGWTKVQDKTMHYHGVAFDETLMEKEMG